MVSFGASIVIANFKIFQFSSDFSPGSVFIIFGSVLIFSLSHFVASRLYIDSDIYNSFYQMYEQPYFWIVLVLIVTLSLSADI